MKSVLVRFLKDFTAGILAWTLILIGIFTLVVAIEAPWSKFYIKIPTAIYTMVIFYPLIKYWIDFFNKMLKTYERDPTQS